MLPARGAGLAPGNAAARVGLGRALYLGGGYAEAWAEVERARSLGQSVPADRLRDHPRGRRSPAGEVLKVGFAEPAGSARH
jgi:hypothetical protein